MFSRKGNQMNAVVDSKGNEIKVGSLIKVKGSQIVRQVKNGASWLAGTQEIYVDKGLILAIRTDNKDVSKYAWVTPSKIEVIG
jgi:hypothetical protein